MATVYVISTTTDITAISGYSSLADGDRLVFAEGSQTINASGQMSSLDTSGKNLNALQFTSSWSGTIGSDTYPFTLNVSNGTNPRVVYDAGNGSLYIKPRSGGTISRLQAINGGTLYLPSHSGTVTRLEVDNRVTASIDGAVTNLTMSGGNLLAAYNATAFTDALIVGGVAEIQRTCTTLTVGGTGRVKMYRSTSGTTLPAATTVYVYGGSLDWRGGSITTLYAYSPVDFSNARENVTITNLYTTPTARRLSKLTSRYATITVTNTTTYGE